MIVKDPQGANLGKIVDLMVDFESEKVAYAVFSPEPVPGLFTGRKLLAVPLAAFGPGAGNDHLVMRTSPQKLADAKGLGIDNWPGLRRSDWGAELFWQEPVAPPGERQSAGEKRE